MYFIFIDRIESSFNFISKPFASFQWPYFGFKAYLTLFGIGVCDALHYIFLTFQKEQVYMTVKGFEPKTSGSLGLPSNTELKFLHDIRMISISI